MSMNIWSWAGDVVGQLVECLSSMHGVLGSVLCIV